MKEIQLAKSPSSFDILDRWHERFAESLSFDFRTERVETSLGFTEVITTGSHSKAGGSVSAPPLLVLHGAMAGAPFALGELCDYPSRRKIYAVNIPGQSTRAAQVRLDFRSDDYSRWLSEVMDSLSLDRVILCGVSWGGSVALQMAKHCPERIDGMLLVVPGSVVRGPVFQGIWHVAIPMMKYKMFPNDKNRDAAFSKILTSKDSLWSPYLGDAVKHWKVDFSIPPLVNASDLSGLHAPVYVIAAEHDLSFPGAKLIDQSKVIFPNLVGSHLLKGSRHSPSFLQKDREAFTRLFEEAIEMIVANQNAELPS